MRVALFGGSFDPPHHGHLAIAGVAADAFGLDQVLFAPAGRQPLKLAETQTTFDDRFAMVELACAQNPRFRATDLDAPRPDGLPNYTVDTLLALHQRMPQATIFSLAGADSFLGLPYWHEPDRLLELAEWIVVSRPGFSIGSLTSMGFNQHERAKVHLLNDVHEDVAATDLRERLERGDPCADLLAPAVLAYIQTHDLYR